MAEEQKPAATPAVDPTPAVTEISAAEPATEITPAATTETPAEAPAEEKITKTEKPVEPIHSGALGYKAPGLVNSFRFSKKYFWFGDEAVSTQSLSHYLRGEKPEVAHPAAAWSSQTGKGILYFVKHADQKATPAGVLNLAEATDLTKDGTIAFHFKLHGHKHTFEATSAPERNGWFMAAEKIIEEAKASRDEILASAGYKEQLEKLGKPAALAVAGASVAKEGSTPKKSTEGKPTESAAPARTGSSSSEDAEGKKKSKSKSRSLSRKRGSIFGNLLGKKDEKAEEKKEEKKEEEAAAPAATEPSAESTEEATAAVAAAPVPALEGPSDEAKPAETTETAETTEPVAEAAETPKAAPKPTKRGSIFGSLASKLRSPTTEKKEADIVPPVPAKDEPATETPAEAPKIEENPAEATDTPAEAPKETAEEALKEEAPTTTPTATLKSKRGSIFGNLTGSVKKEKSDGEGEAKTNKLTGLFRNASKAGKSKDAKKKDATTPPRVEEAAEPATTEETPAKEAEAAPAIEPIPAVEPNSLGDVVPAAVTVGQAPKSTPEVSAAA